MTEQRLALGERGEDLAIGHLRGLGYKIVERNFRVRAGEVDIIARDGEVIVFVEVKSRQGGRFGLPAEAVTRAKQRKLSQVALEYLGARNLTDCPARFDVVGVDFNDRLANSPRIEVFKNAFELCFES